jgi:CRP-like cAMP-binding protein
MSQCAKPQSPVGNRIFAALSGEEYKRILPGLDQISLSQGEAVYECGERQSYAYFPTTSIVSLIYTMEDGATAELAMVGNEGLVGIASFMGGESRPNQAIVQHAGSAIRMKVKTLREEFKHCGSFQFVLLRYTQALITQISQIAVCNGLHTVEQRLTRWLLLTRDRVKSDGLQVTQESLSNALGVRREAITLAVGCLRHKALIICSRGHIQILNGASLEAAACECYRVVKDEYDRLLG